MPMVRGSLRTGDPCLEEGVQNLGSDGSRYALAQVYGPYALSCGLRLGTVKSKETSFHERPGFRPMPRSQHFWGARSWRRNTGMQITAYGISGIPVFQIQPPHRQDCMRGKEMRRWGRFSS